MDALETVIHYHDRTKHHPQRHARSLGYMDWATQPDPFRRYAGAPLVPLAPLIEDETPPYDRIYEPGAVASSDVSARSLSRFLECSLAISAWKEYGDTRWALRVNPSSGNLHPTEGYLIIDAVEDIGRQPGVYHYAPKEHGLEQRTKIEPGAWTALTAGLPRGSFFVGLTSILWRETWKYGERAFRYCQHDVGHALGALRLAAAMLGWRLVMLDHLADSDVGRLLGVDRDIDFKDAEREEPDLLAVVFPQTESPAQPLAITGDSIARATRGHWMGQANRLSKDHVDWDVIDQVADAACKPTTSSVYRSHSIRAATVRVRTETTSRSDGDRSSKESTDSTAHRIIRQRRSAVDFDAVTSISRDAFFGIMARVMPGPESTSCDSDDPADHERTMSHVHRIPFDVWPWSPAIHLFMFVHRIGQLAPGLYVLVRDPTRIERIKEAVRADFTWTTPPNSPSELPLYCLAEGDCRTAAAQLSLGQAIAGDSAFSLGMVADFKGSLTKHGPWFYRRFFWEAGLVGQVLYLEAEAAGIRATGIGAYYDDPVHDLFGLTGHGFQSMYHFTMGGPVHDTRLTTLPAYDWSEVFVDRLTSDKR